MKQLRINIDREYNTRGIGMSKLLNILLCEFEKNNNLRKRIINKLTISDETAEVIKKDSKE